MTDPRPCPLTHPDGGAPDLPPDRYVCRTCTGTLRGLLSDLAGLMDDLDTALTRQARMSGRLGRAGPTEALPFAAAASEAGWVARQTILVWVDWVAGVRGHDVPQTWAQVGQYLREATDWIARHPDGPQCTDELIAAVRNAIWAIDRPADRTYVGVCGADVHIDARTLADPGPVIVTTTCVQALYATVRADSVTCPACGTEWDVAARQAQMLDKIRDLQLPAADLARVLGGRGLKVTAAVIRQWKRRGRLAIAGDNTEGRPLYRVGDVLRLARTDQAMSVGGETVAP